MDSNTFLFDPTVLIVGHSQVDHAQVASTLVQVVAQ